MKLLDEINFLISKIEISIKSKKSYFSDIKKEHINLYKNHGLSSHLRKSNKNKKYHRIFKHINSIFHKEYSIMENTTVNHQIKYGDIQDFLLLKKSFLSISLDGKYNISYPVFQDRNNIFISNIISQNVLKIKKYYGKLYNEYNPYYSLNTIFSKDGIFIYIPNNTILNKPIEIFHLFTGSKSKSFFNIRKLIIIGKESSVQIVEHFKCLKKSSILINSVNEIHSLNKSNIEYYNIQNNSKNTSIIDNTFFHQKKDSNCTIYTFSLGGDLIQNHLNFFSCGIRTNSSLYGLSFLSKNEYLNNSTLIHHLSSYSSSYQLYKNIVSENSSGIFNGKIIVNQSTKGVNAFQKNKNILLSNYSNVSSIPQLEIFSKDVKCSHGCTIGYIQKNELFYLQSRGISKKKSKILLLLSFLEELLHNIHLISLKKFIYQRINKKLEKYL